MKEKKKQIGKYSILLVLGLVLLDQIIKVIVVNNLVNAIIIPNVLEFRFVQNTGGAFGVGSGKLMNFIITNIVILGLVIRFLIRQKERINSGTRLVLLMVIAGGMGNLIDRILRGYVVDYICLFPITHFPIFNLADLYIVLGWVGFVFLFAKYSYEEIQTNRKVKKRE